MKVLFILPVLGQPRYSKRISMLKSQGAHAQALYFERDYYEGRLPECDCESLGRIEHRNYLKRIFVYLKSLKIIRQAAKNVDVVYSFELDLGFLNFISTLFLKKKRVIEIGDIREIQSGASILSKLLRLIEGKLFRRVNLLVVTSPYFYTEYYRKWVNSDVEYLVIENKLEGNGVKRSTTQANEFSDSDKIRIGYFGLLRCEWSFKFLTSLLREYPTGFSLLLAGKPNVNKEVFENLISLHNVEYLGEYKSPDDLEKLYLGVDVVWGVYEPFSKKRGNYNALWAKTNRFYESQYFGKPIVVLEGSGDACFVQKHLTGLVINERISTATFVEELCFKNISSWKKNLQLCEVDNFVYMDEAKLLREALED